MSKSEEQEIWEIMLLNPDLHCTCDESFREKEIHQAKGHYHHCMLWQVANAIEVSLRVSRGDVFVFDGSGKFGRFKAKPSKGTKSTEGKL